VTRFGVRGGDRDDAATIVRIVEQRRQARLAEIERQQAVFDSIVALPPPPPQTHRVRPGETLYGIAAQYNVTPEVLKSMNGLTSDRIRIGQELVVRRFRRINGAVVEYYGPPQ
jgi:LysM repeat protein